jgi:hypothetical protein
LVNSATGDANMTNRGRWMLGCTLLLTAVAGFAVWHVIPPGSGNGRVVLDAQAASVAGGAMQLSFRVGRLDLAEVAGQRNFAVGDPVYVTLRPGEPYWYATSVCREFPVVPQGDVALRGQVVAVDSVARAQGVAPSVLTVRYGIERQITVDGAVDRAVSVVLSVDADGNAGVAAVTAAGG